MKTIDLTKYSDRELSLTVFNTYDLYKFVRSFYQLTKQGDMDKGWNEYMEEVLAGYKYNQAQWDVLFEDARQHFLNKTKREDA
jgi:hypothetical protein